MGLVFCENRKERQSGPGFCRNHGIMEPLLCGTEACHALSMEKDGQILTFIHRNTSCLKLAAFTRHAYRSRSCSSDTRAPASATRQLWASPSILAGMSTGFWHQDSLSSQVFLHPGCSSLCLPRAGLSISPGKPAGFMGSFGKRLYQPCPIPGSCPSGAQRKLQHKIRRLFLSR